MSVFQFPALAISGVSVLFVEAISELETCSRKALKEGYYKTLKVYDPRGQVAVVSDLSVRSSRLANLLRNRVRVLPTLEVLEEPVALEELKAVVLSTLKSGAEIWETVQPLEEYDAVINRARSHEDVIMVFRAPRQ